MRCEPVFVLDWRRSLEFVSTWNCYKSDSFCLLDGQMFLDLLICEGL